MWTEIAIASASVIAVTSYKYLPLVYFVRFYAIPIKYLRFRKSPKNLKKFSDTVANSSMSLFGPVTRHTYCAPLECDFFGFHKNNATYQTELDLNRTEVLLAKLYPFFLRFHEKTGRYPYVPLATIGIYFLKEISPFQSYSIENRILGWDEKWIFVLSKFLVGERVVCLSVGKLVFKDGRKTIKPADVIEDCGYDREKIEKVRAQNLQYVKSFVDPQDFLDLTFSG
ncbi:DEKNAAC100850 [Brettanomyces naardenensis]|uniref:DEKNAAC100850 n=1 Tax=Brettanomyces naardenensis TaxID=13370 RepID=A0A448YEF4_BRENA|nr:DEKNAAC100850 [Brettanomyces naardenensis]